MPRRKANYSRSGEASNSSDIAPSPRTGRPPRKGTQQRRKRKEETSGDTDSDDGGDVTEDFPFGSGQNRHTTGIFCKRHIGNLRHQPSSQPRIRTLYSRFPSSLLQEAMLHILSTVAIYFAIFPFINCVWTYFINMDDEVTVLFNFISQEPTNERGFYGHVRKMRWMTWPSFTAECVSLLIASSIKDTFFFHWERLTDDVSLTDLVTQHIKRRYRR
uniref:Uncharacterized LOC104265703 n=1 Tax=Ciona intestinalis TaxID=7719 RepID=F7B1A5_CIOIN|nr:uncharacterized protein LOC104265703 [Ciona intestinalis]|eukprot:XP_009858579.1 uncharacterized protein LOC104265703 [Ciona intestinalis]